MIDRLEALGSVALLGAQGTEGLEETGPNGHPAIWDARGAV